MIVKAKKINIDISRFYLDVVCYITTVENNNDTDWYTLIKSNNSYENKNYEYIIRQGYSRGIDSYGWDYLCNKEDLYELIEAYKSSNHPFVLAIKGYIKKLKHDCEIRKIGGFI